MTATVEDRLAGIEKHAEQMLNRLSDMDRAVIPGRITNDTLSYWEEEPHASAMKGFRPERRRELVLPEGYKPRSVWKTFSGFLRDGVKAHFAEAGANASTMAQYAEKYASVFKAVQGMSTLAGADGGFAVLPEFAPNIRDRVYQNDLFSRTDNYTIGGNRMTFPRSAEKSRADGERAGGIRAYWVGEGDPLTKSNPKLAETECKLKKLAVVVYLTQEMIDDNGYTIEQWVNRKVVEEFNFMLGLGVTRGVGGAQMLGYLKSPARVVVPAYAGQAVDSIVPENILAMWSRRLSVGNPADLAWYINQNCEPQLNGMTIAAGTGGQVVYLPPGGLSGSPYATLMGRPVIPTEFNSTIGDEGDIALCNLKEYVSISKGGITEAASIHVEFLTDQLAVRFILRVDGRPYDDSPVTPYQSNGSDDQSAFVTLAAR